MSNYTAPVIIYTDGACVPNPGPGGWGVVMTYKDNVREIYGGTYNTTNNRMELTAVIKGLEALTRPCDVILYSDSRYVIDGMSKWIFNWKKKNWTKIKNPELWKHLDEVASRHKVTWCWVKGHSGNLFNERADVLANKGIPFDDARDFYFT